MFFFLLLPIILWAGFVVYVHCFLGLPYALLPVFVIPIVLMVYLCPIYLLPVILRHYLKGTLSSLKKIVISVVVFLVWLCFRSYVLEFPPLTWPKRYFSKDTVSFLYEYSEFFMFLFILLSTFMVCFVILDDTKSKRTIDQKLIDGTLCLSLCVVYFMICHFFFGKEGLAYFFLDVESYAATEHYNGSQKGDQWLRKKRGDGLG